MADSIRGHRAHTVILDDLEAPAPADARETTRRWFTLEDGVLREPVGEPLWPMPSTYEEFKRLYCTSWDPEDDGDQDTRL